MPSPRHWTATRARWADGLGLCIRIVALMSVALVVARWGGGMLPVLVLALAGLVAILCYSDFFRRPGRMAEGEGAGILHQGRRDSWSWESGGQMTRVEPVRAWMAGPWMTLQLDRVLEDAKVADNRDSRWIRLGRTGRLARGSRHQTFWRSCHADADWRALRVAVLRHMARARSVLPQGRA